jgi:hypothetical protein
MPGATLTALGQGGDWVQTDWMSNALRYATRAHLRRLELLYGQPLDCGMALANPAARRLEVAALTHGWLLGLTIAGETVESAALRAAEVVSVVLTEPASGGLSLRLDTRSGARMQWTAPDRAAADALFAFADSLHRQLAQD